MNQHAPPLDLAALAIFRAVAQEGSVTRAAERLQRVQSNVTTRVRQLEADVSATLFLREGKRMALTAEGELLLGYADRLLALAEEARQALRPGEPGGRLRLGSMESTAASRLPAPLARLVGQGQQPVGVALQHLPLGRERHALALAQEQRGAHVGLQLAHARGHVRLRALQALGGPRHAAFLGDGAEDGQGRQIQGLIHLEMI